MCFAAGAKTSAYIAGRSWTSVDQDKGQAIPDADVKRLLVLARSANNLIDLEE